MAPKGNNMIPNAHFHKDWKRYVKTWFNQPARKLRRRENRIKKAHAVAPKPVAGPLRPTVRCPTIRYHTKVRAGRGFTLQELKAARLTPSFARSVGIAVDFRRRNKSVESVQVNTQRLKEYRSKLILFPLHKKKLRAGESNEEEQKMATQFSGVILPIKQAPIVREARVPTNREKRYCAYATLRKARTDEKLVGIRAKRQKEAAENPDDIAKMDTKKGKNKGLK